MLIFVPFGLVILVAKHFIAGNLLRCFHIRELYHFALLREGKEVKSFGWKELFFICV